MLELVRNIFSKSSQKDSSDLLELRDRLWSKFIANPAHQWINSDVHLERSFKLAIHSLPGPACLKFLNQREVIFIPGQGTLACAIASQKNTDIILIFPDLIKIFHSASYLRAVSVVMHELGHLFYEHSKNVMDILEAQVQADAFALECGYGHEIQEVLLDSPQTTDTRVRISRLTAEILTRDI